jgi:hypothetical protein
MGKSRVFFAAVAAASCGFFVAPSFADDRLPPPSVPTILAGRYDGPVARRETRADRKTDQILRELESVKARSSAEIVAASNPVVPAPTSFATSGDFNAWLKKLEKKLWKDLVGKDLPADEENDNEKAFKDLKQLGKATEGAAAPRGALVFYKERLALANGDSTVVGVGAGSDAPDPGLPIGSPLGWAQPVSAGSGGTAGGGDTGGNTGGGGNAGSGGNGGTPAAPLPAMDLSKLPANVKAMVEKANWITEQHYNYLWGGGHNMEFKGPYDCSGAVSAVLHAGGVLDSPRVSGDFTSWGDPGPGVVTLYCNAEHIYMSINGRFFGTSGSNPGGGAAWFDGAPRPGFVVRHVPLTK